MIDIIGYWSEECHYGDAEISGRISNYTHYKAGFVTDIKIDMQQTMPCSSCECQRLCKLEKKNINCFRIHRSKYRNVSFVKLYGWKCKEFFKELEQKKRTVYCASLHDPDSIRKHIYNAGWAKENFNYYINNGN